MPWGLTPVLGRTDWLASRPGGKKLQRGGGFDKDSSVRAALCSKVLRVTKTFPNITFLRDERRRRAPDRGHQPQAIVLPSLSAGFIASTILRPRGLFLLCRHL